MRKIKIKRDYHIHTVPQRLILLIRDMVVECWNRRFGCETIHPTQKFTSMNLLQMPLRDNMGIIIFDLRGCGGC